MFDCIRCDLKTDQRTPRAFTTWNSPRMARNSKRNPNFSASELSILTEEVEKRKQLLFAKQSTTVCNSLKRKAWEDIAEQVNAVNCSNVMRSGEDVKKKWTCMSSESKKKLALNKREQRKTGGGSLPSNVSITPMDERIEGIIGPTAITGVEGGIDVLDEATTSASSPKPTDAPSIMESADNGKSNSVKFVQLKNIFMLSAFFVF